LLNRPPPRKYLDDRLTGNLGEVASALAPPTSTLLAGPLTHGATGAGLTARRLTSPEKLKPQGFQGTFIDLAAVISVAFAASTSEAQASTDLA
jgi:hypothetical protein